MPRNDHMTGFGELEDRLAEALEQQAATSEILRVISQSPMEIQPVFDTIVAAAMKLCRATSANFFTYDGELIHLAALVNATPEGAEAVRRLWPRPPGRDLAATRAVLTCSTVSVPDVLDDADFKVNASAAFANFRSILAVPLVRGGSPIGAIAVGRPKPGPFPSEQVSLLETFAAQAVIAIENVRLFNETKEALERQTATSEILRVISRSPSDVQPVFDTIVKAALKLCGADSANVVTFDGTMVRVAAFSASNPDAIDAVRRHFQTYPRPPSRDTANTRAVLTRSVVMIPDVLEDRDYAAGATANAAGYRSVLAVPLMRKDAPIGAVTVARVEPGHFPERQVALLQTFADQAVIAIENVRLFNETKEALERQTATSEILRVISQSPTDVQPVFDAIAESVVRLCGADHSYVARFDGELLYPLAFHGFSTDALAVVSRRFPMRPSRENIVGRVAMTREVVNLPDVLADSEYSREFALAGGWRSLLGVPMLRDGELIGAIGVGRPTPGAFPDKHVELLKTFADQSVIAIENVQLFKELQARTGDLTRSVGELRALGEVGQAISSTLDLETVLSTIVSRAIGLTGMSAGAIYEYDELREEFNLHTADSLPNELVHALRASPLRKGEGALGRLAITAEPVPVNDITDESVYRSGVREVLLRLGYRSLLAVPLLCEDRLLGGLVVLRTTSGEFAPQEIDLLRTFATQSALAIRNARLFREIAEKGRQLEAASRHKSDFLASMSHELRTPLNAILGFNEMILGEIYGDVPASMKEPLEDIQSSGKHLLRLINNVLDLAKIEAGRMELSLADYSVHDTVESVRATLRPLAADKGLEFVATVPADISIAYGDFGRITQCLMNLAGNSLKFTKAGKVEISVETRGDLLVYKVADTGIGIPPDKLETVFAEFKQTDATIASEYGGTGLGLSISRKFVEMHGGRIWVESELGRGSTFIFEIPLRVGAGAQA